MKFDRIAERRKFCKKCKKFESRILVPESDNVEKIKDPLFCKKYIDIICESGPCKKKRKIDRFLEYFPVFNRREDLYDDIKNNESFAFECNRIIGEEEQLEFWGVFLPVRQDQNVGAERTPTPESLPIKAKEIWRCKGKEKAQEIRDILNKEVYYWIPSSSQGNLYIERIPL